MKSILAAIARVLSTVRAFAWRLVQEGGRLVMRLMPGPAPDPMPPLPVELETSAPDADDLAPVRRVAGILAQDRVPTPAEMAGLSELQLDWLRVLSRRDLCRVMAADNAALRAHLRSTMPMKGMPRADRDTVQALLDAREREDRVAEAEAERDLAWAPAL